jgi:hypothetical protein
VPSDSIVKEPARAAINAAQVGHARTNKRPAHLFWGILLPTATNGQDYIPNLGFVKSSVNF